MAMDKDNLVEILNSCVEVSERMMGRCLSDIVAHPECESLLNEDYSFYKGKASMARSILKLISNE